MPNLVRHSTGVFALLASLGLTAAASADHASIGLGGGAQQIPGLRAVP